MLNPKKSSKPWLQRADIFFNLPKGAVVAGFLVQFSALFTFLLHNNYPLFTTEVALLILFIGVLSLIMGILYRFVSRITQYIFITVLCIIAIDLYFDSLWLLPLAVLLVVVAREKTLFLLALFATLIVITKPIEYYLNPHKQVQFPKVVESNKKIEPNKSDQPFILHLILDSHIGTEGLGAFVSDTQSVKMRLKSFYKNYGFNLYGGAYSKHFHTVNSIPFMLNFGQASQNRNVGFNPIKIEENLYFDFLQSKGYKINASQSEWVDYCSSSLIHKCITYPKSGPLLLTKAPLQSYKKAYILFGNYIKLSHILEIAYINTWVFLKNFINISSFIMIPETSSIGGKVGLENLSQMIKEAKPGEVYFAHVLLPHEPYVYKANCELINTAWERRIKEASNNSQEAREQAYLEQMDCGYKLLDKILKNLDVSQAKNNNLVIIHGDHGSRVTNVDPIVEALGIFSDRDLVTSYSTMFAVRYQNRVPAYFSDKVSIDQLLKNLVLNDLKAITRDHISDQEPTVLLENKYWTPTQSQKLPKEWPQSNTIK